MKVVVEDGILTAIAAVPLPEELTDGRHGCPLAKVASELRRSNESAVKLSRDSRPLCAATCRDELNASVLSHI
jgi:hypothetical protein